MLRARRLRPAHQVERRDGGESRVRGLLRRSRRREVLTILVVAIMGSVVVGAGAWYWQARNSSQNQSQFRTASDHQSDDLSEVLLQYGGLLSQSAALFYPDGGPSITRSEYDSYLDAGGIGTARYPGLLGIGLIQKVVADQVPAFLASLAAEGIHADVTPPGQRAEYCLGSYAAWSDLHASVPLYGYDVCTVPTISETLTRATESGQQEVIPGWPLGPVFASDFLLVQPVYSGSPVSVSQREQQVSGWVLAIVNGPKLLKAIQPERGVEFMLFGDSSVEGPIPILRWPSSVKASGAWTLSKKIGANGNWTVQFRADPSAVQTGSTLAGPIVFLAVGLLAVALLVALLASLWTGRRRALQSVEDATQSLKVSEERFRSLAGSAPMGILEVSAGAYVNYLNRRAAEIAGRSIEDLKGRGWLEAVHPDERAELAVLVDLPRPERPDVATSFRVQRPDGEIRHVRMSAAPRSPDPDSGYVVTVEDITDEVHTQEELAHQAFYDPLTGLPNRALFLDRLNLELAWRERTGSNIAVLFLDIDQFKIVNDSLGHATGDAVLKEAGVRFAETVRAGETAARFSGDEFIFIIRDIRTEQDAITAAKRLLGVLASPIRHEGKELLVTGSIGIVVPGPRADAPSVLRDADTAMYQAKAAGRNRYELFDEVLHSRSIARLELEGDLRDALSRDEFEIYYQPKVVPTSGRPFGAEALIRWRHPSRGMVPPLEFIPVAEDSGLIKPIGDWVFERAVAQLAAWDALPDGPRLAVLSVNLSARQLDDPGTPDMVRDVLTRYGVDPARIALEVTESAVMSDGESTRRTLAAFKDLGLRIAIDDFGTGYSSLAYLHTLPVTTVKIDRAFIERLDSGDDSTPVVRAIVEMGHAMGLRVIAEGVSAEHLRDAVSELGCDVAQGFFWAPALPAGEFVQWWREAELKVVMMATSVC